MYVAAASCLSSPAVILKIFLLYINIPRHNALICNFDFHFHECLNQPFFSVWERFSRKKTTMRAWAQKTQFVMAKLYCNHFTWRNDWENVPFVAKMMAKIRNISVTKPPFVFCLPIWAMFLQSGAQHWPSVWFIYRRLFPVCYDVIVPSRITWLSVERGQGQYVSKMRKRSTLASYSYSTLAKSQSFCLAAWHDIVK